MKEKITINDVENLTNIHNELCFKINNNYAFKVFKNTFKIHESTLKIFENTFKIHKNIAK